MPTNRVKPYVNARIIRREELTVARRNAPEGFGRLAAVLAADVAGYGRLVSTDEEGTIVQLKAHRALLFDPKLVEHNGRLVKTTGDGLLAEFASVVDAVRCAVDVQRGMATRNAEVIEDKRIEFRIGVHVGDIGIQRTEFIDLNQVIVEAITLLLEQDRSSAIELDGECDDRHER